MLTLSPFIGKRLSTLILEREKAVQLGARYKASLTDSGIWFEDEIQISADSAPDSFLKRFAFEISHIG